MTRDDLLAQLTTAEAERLQLLARLVALEVAQHLGGPQDHLLTVRDAAVILAVTPDWLYRHADEFRFTVRPGPGQLRFSTIGIQDYLRRERG
ncbi:MAG: hypothetical protein JO197_15655 [Acidobacteria bacterium]|nr:hypothetical protein [Acidobacteriota bacterium]MBV9475041.1 hypothetical protein [Acidobacteriota bacterium]